jgi:hypothetical protein
MAPRLTPNKVARWTKRLDTVHASVSTMLEEVREQASNPKAKHYQDLCDLRTDLSRVQERLELCQRDTLRVRP